MCKLLIINSVIGFGSTGRIVLDIAKEYEQKGHEVKIAYGRSAKGAREHGDAINKYGVRIGNDMDVFWHIVYTRITDKQGLASKHATKVFLRWAETYNPDILWLHNIHGYYINYEMLFEWIKSRPRMQVKWTLHDCWAFTGHCAYFTFINCDKWKIMQNSNKMHYNLGCSNCPQLKCYPKSIIDNSKLNYKIKKKVFTNVKDLTIITPSEWLADLVRESFLSEYSIEIQYNKIDRNAFKPMTSDFKKEHCIEDKKIILGVASVWEKRKGLDDFYKLAELVENNRTDYQVVLVGLNHKQQRDVKRRKLNIVSVPRVKSKEELAKIYSSADVFVNPTREDNYPTVNLEAEACGTRVITYDIGGCKETIKRKDSIAVRSNVYEIFNHLK